jgi:formylglycine-generating enzyme required for sulfatase activity
MKRLQILLAGALGHVGFPAAMGQTDSFTVDAWAFDRGNARVFTEEYASAGPMVAFGGSSPVYVEYDIDFTSAGDYLLNLHYAAAEPRPIELRVDGRSVGSVCRLATGSWDTRGALWEESAPLQLSAGRHSFRLERADSFPHVTSLRFDALSGASAGPVGYRRPKDSYAWRLASSTPAADIEGRRTDPMALRLAIEDLMATFGARYPGGPAYLERLQELTRQLENPELAGQAETNLLSLERQALLANPLLAVDRLIVLQRGFPDGRNARRALGQALGVGSLNAHTSDDTPRQGHWNDTLAVLSGIRGTPQFETLYAPGDGRTVIDPVLHFDADRLLFAMQGEREKNWRLFEIRMDGTGLRQVTPDDGEDVAHFDPCYLPDDRVVFASTAVYQGLPCEFGAQAMTCLYLLDPRRQAVRQLTFEQDSDWCPTVLPNGRVLYLRWEYTDQSHANSRILFHMNPDGTDQREFRGSGSWFPPSFFYAKPVPGHPHQVIGVAGGHHGIPRSGRLLLMDPSLGRRDGEGIVQEIPGRGQRVEPIVRDRLIDGVWPQFLMPWPLSPKYHLVSAKLRPEGLWGLYLADVFDNLTLIAEVDDAALLWPIALQPVPKPPVIPDRVNLASAEATVFITDVYSGPGLAGVPRGSVKALRLIEYYFSRRGLGGLYGTLGIDGPWDIKRILGTVPVESDGSAHFRIPANTPLSIQPVDDQGQALQLMRSWFVGMPGEAISCGGCHEPQHEVSPNRATLASRLSPAAIEPWHGPARGFSFVREVQPVLDKHCVSCHDGSQADRPSFRGDQWLTDWSSQLAGRWDGGGKFTEAYYQLQRYARRPGIEGDRRMFTPLDYHFSTTELAQLLRKGHHHVQLDPEAWQRLAAWFDLNAPFYGTWGEIPQFTGGYGPHSKAHLDRVHARAMELRRLYVPMGPHPDYEFIPETPPFDATPVIPPTPEAGGLEAAGGSHASARADGLGLTGIDGWPFNADTARALQQAAAIGDNTVRAINLGNGVTIELTRIPGGRFLMGSREGACDEQPRSIQNVSPFWMARCEISNLQFRQFRPTHESRTEDRQGYQFGVLAYNQDHPEQPAVRVSWLEAMAFCAWLTERTGLHISLPTEAQWEWACRAGADTPFWFGDADADYSTFANLGDRRLLEFAADTALDNYTAARPMVNPNRYDAWIPRDDRFDDGGFVTEPIGKYLPNPWGLHDLQGNAWEWTRSIQRPYPYQDEDGRNELSDPSSPRIIRGGSWRDRPHRATSSFRLAYPPWQRVYNVGFRVVCEADLETASRFPE